MVIYFNKRSKAIYEVGAIIIRNWLVLLYVQDLSVFYLLYLDNPEIADKCIINKYSKINILKIKRNKLNHLKIRYCYQVKQIQGLQITIKLKK